MFIQSNHSLSVHLGLNVDAVHNRGRSWGGGDTEGVGNADVSLPESESEEEEDDDGGWW